MPIIDNPENSSQRQIARVLSLLQVADVVVFDLDGTLYDDAAYLRAADEDIARWISSTQDIDLAKVTDALGIALAQQERRGFIDRLLADLGLSSTLVEGVLDCLRNVNANVELFPWVLPLLCRLDLSQTKLYVLTNGNVRQQQNKIRILRIDQLPFKVRVMYADRIRAKPAPDGLFAIANECAVSSGKLLMIGNDSMDRGCANSAGAEFIDVRELTKVINELTFSE